MKAADETASLRGVAATERLFRALARSFE